MDWVTYKEHIFISYSSGEQEIQNQGTCNVVSGEGHTAACNMTPCFCLPFKVDHKGTEKLKYKKSLVSFYEAPVPSRRAEPLTLNHFLKPTPLNPVILKMKL